MCVCVCVVCVPRVTVCASLQAATVEEVGQFFFCLTSSSTVFFFNSFFLSNLRDRGARHRESGYTVLGVRG